MPARRALVICVLAVLTSAVAACRPLEGAVNTFGEVIGAGANALSTRSRRDDPIIYEITGPVAVDVDSFGGDIVIRGDRRLERGRITLTRRAIQGPGRTAEADASLDEIFASVELFPADLSPRLEVRTSTTNPEPHFVRADLLIEMPAVTDVRVRNRNGGVLAEGIEGRVDIVNEDGEIRVLTPAPMVQPVTIINNHGDIHYRVRGESRGAFDVEVVRGTVTHYVRKGAFLVHEGTDHNTLHATLNRGENPVVLRAADGDVRIAVVADPTRVGTFIVE